jgi:hypothetical protein
MMQAKIAKYDPNRKSQFSGFDPKFEELRFFPFFIDKSD